MSAALSLTSNASLLVDMTRVAAGRGAAPPPPPQPPFLVYL
jgi:hypothetical protein